MTLGFNLSGRLEKLKIEAFTDKEFMYPSGQFEVDFNPKSLSKSYQVTSSPRRGRGKAGSELNFVSMKPQVLQFNFLIDGSGALEPYRIGFFHKKIEVQERIAKFMDTVYKYEGQLHRPKWLKLSWGPHLFKCVVKDINVEYTMFRPDGSPLRATIKASFLENLSNKRRSAEIKLRSPDLTHQRVINEGDNLVSMTHKIYETITPAIQVAQANDLDSLRNLSVGDKLFFPPLD